MLPEAIGAGVPNMRRTTRTLSDADIMDAATFLDGGLIVNPRRVLVKIGEASLAKFKILHPEDQSLTSRCTQQIYVARSLGIQRAILVLAPASSVPTILDLLRSCHPKEIVGCVDDFLWMQEATMSIVVAAPEQEGVARINLRCLDAVSSPCAPEAQIRQVMSTIATSWERQFGTSPPENWLADDYAARRAAPSDQLQDLLARYLPEALACPGLGDVVFQWIARSFAPAWSSFSTAFTDWSSVLAVLPGLVLASMDASCVVVAPLPRVDQLTRLVQGFVDCMGIKGVSVGCGQAQGAGAAAAVAGRILVGTPDGVHLTVSSSSTTCDSLNKVVLLETDVLLASGFVPQVEALLSIPGIAVALHAAVRSAAVDDLVARLLTGEFSPRSGLWLDIVDLYSVRVPDEEHKVAQVYKLWKVLRTDMELAVYCNSPDSVREVSRALQARGAAVREHHSDMRAEELEQSEREHHRFAQLVVTDIHVPGSLMDVVLYDQPSTAQEFVERVGAYRGKSRAKVVFCFVSSAEEQQLLDSVAQEHQVCFKDLPEKLGRIYRDTIRRP